MSDKQEPTTRRWLMLAIAVCFLWVLFMWAFGPGSTGLIRSGRSADYSWKFADLDDRPASLEAYRGRTVFLNIWATWCGPCVAEMPSIVRLSEAPRLQGKDIAFVCVSVDDTTEAVRRFLEGGSWKMDFFRTEKLPDVFRTDGIPATFIIGPDGRIAASEIGSSQWDNPRTIALLEKLSAQGKRAP